MFLKYPIICSHVYCYSNISLTPMRSQLLVQADEPRVLVPGRRRQQQEAERRHPQQPHQARSPQGTHFLTITSSQEAFLSPSEAHKAHEPGLVLEPAVGVHPGEPWRHRWRGLKASDSVATSSRGTFLPTWESRRRSWKSSMWASIVCRAPSLGDCPSSVQAASIGSVRKALT